MVSKDTKFITQIIFLFVITTFLVIWIIIELNIGNLYSKSINLAKFSSIGPRWELEPCIEMCKKTQNCYGISYDKTAQMCRLMRYIPDPDCKVPRDHTICIKPYTHYSSQINPTDAEKRAHSLFVCQNHEDKLPTYFYHYSNRLYPVHEKLNFDAEIPGLDSYQIHDYLGINYEKHDDPLNIYLPLTTKLPEQTIVSEADIKRTRS